MNGDLGSFQRLDEAATGKAGAALSFSGFSFCRIWQRPLAYDKFRVALFRGIAFRSFGLLRPLTAISAGTIRSFRPHSGP